MILLVDNYDSFVHNLARYFERLGQSTRVVRNDAVDLDELASRPPQAVVLSPGPCTPADAGCCLELVRRFAGHLPILGVCLGHQAIAQALGGHIVRTPPFHGRQSQIRHDGRGVFSGLPNPLAVGRYHSLSVDETNLPVCLEVSARTDEGIVMAVRHRECPVVGVQFHPESILTEAGYLVLGRFLMLAGIEPVPDITGDDERKRPAMRQLPDRPVTF